jgi:hypothetical protein
LLLLFALALAPLSPDADWTRNLGGCGCWGGTKEENDEARAEEDVAAAAVMTGDDAAFKDAEVGEYVVSLLLGLPLLSVMWAADRGRCGEPVSERGMLVAGCKPVTCFGEQSK